MDFSRKGFDQPFGFSEIVIKEWVGSCLSSTVN